MNEDLAMKNIMSLHYELMKATEQYDMYCELRDDRMRELWFHQIELITAEMQMLMEK